MNFLLIYPSTLSFPPVSQYLDINHTDQVIDMHHQPCNANDIVTTITHHAVVADTPRFRTLSLKDIMKRRKPNTINHLG